MVGAAVLGAEEVVLAHLGRREPGGGVAAGNRVLLGAERGHKETVDGVFRRHGEPHRPSHGNVQLVDFPLPPQVLEFPHPLLADDVDIQGVVRRPAFVEVDAGAPGEHHHGESERNHAPQDLERHPAMDRARQFVFGTPPVADGKVEDGSRKSPAKRKPQPPAESTAGGPRRARRWTLEPEIDVAIPFRTIQPASERAGRRGNPAARRSAEKRRRSERNRRRRRAAG